MAWTDRTISILTRMWGEGSTAGTIADALGEGFSRNSVVSKAHRLGLEARESPIGTQALPGPLVRRLWMRLQKLGLATGSFEAVMEAFAFTETGTPEQVARALGLSTARVETMLKRKVDEYGWQAA